MSLALIATQHERGALEAEVEKRGRTLVTSLAGAAKEPLLDPVLRERVAGYAAGLGFAPWEVVEAILRRYFAEREARVQEFGQDRELHPEFARHGDRPEELKVHRGQEGFDRLVAFFAARARQDRNKQAQKKRDAYDKAEGRRRDMAAAAAHEESVTPAEENHQ